MVGLLWEMMDEPGNELKTDVDERANAPDLNDDGIRWTTSTGAIVIDAQAVRQLCEVHCFGTLNWEVDESGEELDIQTAGRSSGRVGNSTGL
ncbi:MULTISPECIES: hypothetical protein [Halobaculum]|uniref:Uncharacterized protein n=2 Tax=Halobaculum TaxID=43927 RepID=A0A8T8WH36_9EURY|nr:MULTISPECIES: hypothetical protein [Halobaculum]QZP39155.1 hypothetical protein K6T50_03680 [Halobaculum magnesiiphilum]QZY04191.1 hypothetical protein K6T36_03550 [Halobaculum roseum]